MKPALLRSCLVLCGLVCMVSSSSAQPPVGALAVDERQVDRYGWAVDYATASAARSAALGECGPGCSVVLTFERCAAYAADQDANSTAVGIVKLTKSSSSDPQDTGLEPAVNPPCWGSETAVSLNLTIPVRGRSACRYGARTSTTTEAAERWMFIDTNVLVRARFTVAPEHSLARARLRDAIGGAERTRISWQIVREYLAVVTRPQTWSAPLVMSEALRDVGWFLSTFDVLEDGPDVTRMLMALCREVPVAGRQVHDANIVATMLAYGERRLLTFDQDDFHRYHDRIEPVDPTVNA